MLWDCSVFGSTASTVCKSLCIYPDNLLPYQLWRKVSEQGLGWLKDEPLMYSVVSFSNKCVVKVPSSAVQKSQKKKTSTVIWNTTGSLVEGKQKAAKVKITVLSIRTISLSSGKYDEYRLHWGRIQSQVKWNGILLWSRGAKASSPFFCERRRLYSHSKKSSVCTVCSLQ